jgi:RNA polymerase sigma-70 factor (ECF subfamily)
MDPSPELVRRAQAGDRAAFDALYYRNVERVYAVCLRMSGDAGTAERLTQDAFVRAWQKLGSFRGDSAFSSWLHRLAVNVVLGEGRRDRRRLARVENVERPEGLEAAADGPDVEAGMDLDRAIATLPKGARTVLVLHDIEGYKHEEIAAMLGTAVGTTKAQLHRARRLLRDRLER